MTKLEQLIKELCPNGVEYKKLGDIVTYSKNRISSQNVDEKSYVGVDNLLPDRGGKTNSNCVPEEGNLTRFDVGDILIGNIRPYLKKIWLADIKGGTNGDVLVIHIVASGIAPKYLYYALSSDKFFLYNMKYAKGAKMPRGDKEAIMKYEIPIPPIEIQEEVVTLLDDYTIKNAELCNILEQELSARKKQYEYYRDLLLDFGVHGGGASDCEWRTIRLGDIGKISMCKRIMKSETSPDGDIPFYKIGTFGGEPNAYISKDTFEKYKSLYSFPKKGDILISAAGTIGRTVVYDGEPAYYQDSNIVWIDNDETKVLNSYLYYVYQLSPWQISTGGTIARLYNDNIANAKINIPPIEEQERIVSILDRFDKLCNDISEGLPAEIEARRKQYEYYRDKLLSFKEQN